MPSLRQHHIATLIGATPVQTFAYTYDLAGRLKNSVRYLGTATSSYSRLTEGGISYDRNGNLTALTRYNESGTAIQTLSYSYNGPKRSNTGWAYDNHGNVTADPQSGMSVAWNAIDLPRTLTSGSASTSRGYLSDGTLAQVSDGSTTRLYVGDMVFTRPASGGTPTLESAGWEGGRLINGSGTGNVLYYVTDHLGSVRVVKDGSGTVRQRFDYYPYGSVSRVYTNSSTTDNSVKRYRFGGKEIAGTSLTDLAGTGAAPGAPYLDFGARLYSPRTATWLSVDPMAEKYYGIGSLTYCAANPVNLVDPTGSIITIWYVKNGEKLFFHYSGTETGIPDSPYVVDVIEAYRYNKENWQQAGFEGESPIVELVERKDIRVSIFTEIGQYSEYFRDNGGIPFIRWNSSEGLETDSGVVLSPASFLAHDADHAIDDLTNANAHSDRKRTLDSQYENAEERRVITGSEQKTAFANGEIRKRQVTRQNHDGHTVYTYGATSNTIDRFTTDYYYRSIKWRETK